MTQEATFFRMYFSLVLHLISGKVVRFLAVKLSTSEVISQKPHRWWKTPTPPRAFRIKVALCQWSGSKLQMLSRNCQAYDKSPVPLVWDFAVYTCLQNNNVHVHVYVFDAFTFLYAKRQILSPEKL